MPPMITSATSRPTRSLRQEQEDTRLGHGRRGALSPIRADDVQVGAVDESVAVGVAVFFAGDGGAPVCADEVQVATADEAVAVEIAFDPAAVVQ